MTTIFMSGSLRIKNLHADFQDRILKVVGEDFNVIVGDADGADKSIQTTLFQNGATNVAVYCTGDKPRNNIGDWEIHKVWSDYKPGTRAYFTAKDVEMAGVADFGLMIWDAKSTGTLNNVLNLLKDNKKSVVFVNKMKRFLIVRDVEQLDCLVGLMSDHAKFKADEKIRILSNIEQLKSEQYRMFG